MSLNIDLSYASLCVGVMLGTACGDILGSVVEGWPHEQIVDRYKGGLLDFQSSRKSYGHYTDDTQMTIALAKSLVMEGKCDAGAAAKLYADHYQGWRGYGGTAHKVLQDLKEGADYHTVGDRYLPGGSFGNGGAMRIAPLGLVYRHAPLDVLHRAVVDALLPTHKHPQGVDGALVQAAAVGYLARSPSTSSPDGWGPLLMYLRTQVAQTEPMKDRLDTILTMMNEEGQPGSSTSFSSYMNTPAWAKELEGVRRLASPFQIEATEAVACSLWALCRHWQEPERGIISAVHYGGDTDTLGAMTGALMGSLHGRQWIPSRWFDNIENGEDGRDILVELGHSLAELDVRQ